MILDKKNRRYSFHKAVRHVKPTGPHILSGYVRSIVLASSNKHRRHELVFPRHENSVLRKIVKFTERFLDGGKWHRPLRNYPRLFQSRKQEKPVVMGSTLTLRDIRMRNDRMGTATPFDTINIIYRKSEPSPR